MAYTQLHVYVFNSICGAMSLNIPNLERNKFLAPFTTYKIGGPADLFVEVHTIDELTHALSEARRSSIPFFLLGCGANILFTDNGFRGLVIRNMANKVTILDNNKIGYSVNKDLTSSNFNVT